jgi:hypothetical protein
MIAYGALRRSGRALSAAAWLPRRTFRSGRGSTIALRAAYYQRALALLLVSAGKRMCASWESSAAALRPSYYQRSLALPLVRTGKRVRARWASSTALPTLVHTGTHLVHAGAHIGVAVFFWRLPRSASVTLRFVGCAFGGGVLALAYLNNYCADADNNDANATHAVQGGRNETVVIRTERLPNSYVDNEGEIAADESDEEEAIYRRAVQTVRFVDPDSGLASRARIVMAKVGGFVAFPGNQPSKPIEIPEKIRSARGGEIMQNVDLYLWEVYQRAPTKKDHSGDFTWKDPAAAKQMGIPLPDYVIGGMDPEFREQLYHAGRAMDAEGIQWSILSAFRDDYRQGLASGYKARVGRSLHGGSKRTGGYGFGRAVDITNADGDAEVVWRWVDKHGAKYGLHRPMPGNDPAHVQSSGEWRKIALSLRETRQRAEPSRDKERTSEKERTSNRVAASK